MTRPTDSKAIYPLLLVYGASTATTTLACIAVVLNTPLTTSATIASKTVSITPSQRFLLLSSYIPFFLVPLMMTVDMAARVSRLIHTTVSEVKAKKTR